MTQSQEFGREFGFNEIFQAEIEVINQRRATYRNPLRPDIILTNKIKSTSDDPLHPNVVTEAEQTDSTGTPVLFPAENANLTGLALSGGGIRSAAFCLGALQALNEARVLERIDYLSTVSGGGYIGCSLSAALEKSDPPGQFPFGVNDVEDETPSMQHVRDYSNYLFPNGAIDLLDNLAIYVRGLVANFVLIMPIILIAAALTILFNPTIHSLIEPDLAGYKLRNFLGLPYFLLTTYLAIALFLIGVIWGLIRSVRRRQNDPEIITERRSEGWISFFSSGPRIVGAVAVTVGICALFEFQSLVLYTMFKHQDGSLLSVPLARINQIVLVLAPFGAAIAFLGRKLAEFVKASAESSATRAQIAGFAAKAAIYFAAIIVPLLLWVVYLNLSYWGICAHEKNCSLPFVGTNHSMAAYWYVVAGYVLFAALFLALAFFLRPNANSLHPLYRDRLGKAFLFQPLARVQHDQVIEPLSLKLSKLSGKHGPYHLINTVLNVQNSMMANRRGRNADFFLFSPRFIGSESTRYVATADYDTVNMGPDLATVMAVSGAAASSSMGAQSIKPLTPTLALLNIRLGFWLRNPSHMKFLKEFVEAGKPAPWNRRANFYFFLELLGLLNETKKSVYLTDGGHIENLGLYELLKRGCRVIVAIDAEADGEMAFGSFNTLVRYARIDLGIEIDLPWQQITNVTKKTNKKIEATGDAKKKRGPHCAIGRITYSWNNGRPDRTGVLVYIKSSLTGDENDYVYHYKKRYWAFPHETTLDQMFSEEQFEAYRALGYHAANGLFDRRDDFAKTDSRDELQADVELLDQLFPRARRGRPGEKSLLAEWLLETPPEPEGEQGKAEA
jgi:Patatin-like phospholipase